MKGMIFIPDITGFSSFVENMPLDLGASIISDLLHIIVQQNSIDLEISEIEGDAVFFYKNGAPLPLHQLMDTFTAMNQAFHQRFNKYQEMYRLRNQLSLKLIVHYGEIKQYNIAGFKKLYGQAVVEAHRLLKNGIAENEYVLVTEEYLRELKLKVTDVLMYEEKESGLINSNWRKRFSKIACHLFPGARRHLVFQHC